MSTSAPPMTPPAGGAALGEVLLASALGGVMTLALLAVVVGHRAGRLPALGRVADAVGRRQGLPGWAALPCAVSFVALLTALFGMFWDISLHIGQGRDEGPLANPAHYFILFGLFGLFTAGVLAVCLPRDGEDAGPGAVRVLGGWHAPAGGVLLAGAGLYALLGFPLDDLWHRLFGQDVTLWGPTHLMLIGGAGLSLVGLILLLQAGRRVAAAGDRPAGARRLGPHHLAIPAAGGLLVGLSVFQAEYDFGVPQFRLVHQPLMIAGAAACALVAARLWAGRGAALGAVVFFLVVRGGVSLLVGPVLGEAFPSLPLYLPAALVVEALALVLVHRPLRFGVVAGLGVGTLGMAGELVWSHVAMPLPWGTDVLLEGLLTTVLVGTAGGVLGALLALGLAGRLPRRGVSLPAVVASLLVVAATVANGLVATVPEGTATIGVAQASAPGEPRAVSVEVRLDPETLADDPSWLTLTAWQGGGLVVDALERGEDGVWRSTRPVPADGSWKTILRLHDGRTLAAVPVYMPADPAIDAEAVPLVDGVTRPFVSEVTVLQRERDAAPPPELWIGASLVVLACSLVLVASLAWGVARVARGTQDAAGPATSAVDVPASTPVPSSRREPVRTS